MTIPEILSNEELRQREYPVTRERVFLAHAGVCPLPQRVSEAIAQYARQCSLGDQETLAPMFHSRETREIAAKLIHANGRSEGRATRNKLMAAISSVSSVAQSDHSRVMGSFLYI